MLKIIRFFKKALTFVAFSTILVQVQGSSLIFRCFAETGSRVTDFTGLQAAINSGASATIEIANDITIPATIAIDKDLTLKAAQGVGSIKLIAAGGRHFNVSGGDITLTFDGNVALDGGGSAGGIQCAAANLTLNNAVIQNCKNA